MRHVLAPATCLLVLCATTHGDARQSDPDGRAPRPVVRRLNRPARVATAVPASVPEGPAATFVPLGDDPEGDMPRELAYSADGSELIVVNRDTDNVMFFDSSTRQITAVVPVGDFPVHVAVSPDNRVAVVANVLSHDVSIIDIATHSEIARVPVSGQQPYRVAITPDSATAVVGVINDAVSSQFSLINLTAATEEAVIPSTPQGVVGFFFSPEPGISGNLFTQFALSPDGTTIVLPDTANSQVAVYDVPTASLVGLVATAAQPRTVDISDDSTLAVVSHSGNTRRVTLIDLPSLLTSTVTTTSDQDVLTPIRLTPAADRVLLSYLNDTFIVDLASGAETARFFTGAVGDIELSFDGQYAIVSNFNFRIIELASESLVRTLPLAPAAEAATSPAALKAAALNNRFGEDVQFYDINGASGFVEGFTLSGPAPEADACHNLAISADGRLAVVANNTSRNVTVVDLCTFAPLAYIDVGRRPLDVAITPDARWAVVCAADENQVVILDLTAMAVVKRLTILSRPSRVVISPDGQMAYVLNVAGTDQVSFIHLDGANSSIVAQLPAGQTGIMIFTYGEISGLTLSPDGSLLAVCDSFNDRLRLYDTASMSQIASVVVGDFPIRAAFSGDSSHVFVANALSDELSVVRISPGPIAVTATIGGIGMPLVVEPDDQGYVYVGAFDFQNPGLKVVDPNDGTIVASLDLGGGRPRASFLSPADGSLYLAVHDNNANYRLVRLVASGPTTHVTGSWNLSDSPSDMAFHDPLGLALISQPVPDGIDVVRVGCDGDLDGDRAVGLGDLAALLVNFGQSGGVTRSDGDIDCDGDVDLTDLATLLASFGTACN